MDRWVFPVPGLPIMTTFCFWLIKYDLNASLAACVIPFLPFDAIKCVIAGVVGPLLKIALRKSGYMK